MAVIQEASADLDGLNNVLSDGDAVFMGQRVITGNDGQVQIVFSDNTHLVVGPGSTLVIEEYLLRGSGTASKFVIDALGGSFRFITGDSPKNAYAINTPTGTMGVRGTEFDLEVDPVSGETYVVLYHGGVRLCDLAQSCVELAEACDIGVIPKNDAAAVLGEDQIAPLAAPGAFPYLKSQRPLRADFKVDNPSRCLEIQIADAGPQPPPVVVPPDDDPPDDDPPDGPPLDTGGHHDNSGGGNGAEGDDGDTENDNPGKGHDKTTLPGNGNGNAWGLYK